LTNGGHLIKPLPEVTILWPLASTYQPIAVPTN
jgi:hypothetical protein